MKNNNPENTERLKDLENSMSEGSDFETMISEDIQNSIEFEKQLSEFDKDALTTFIAIWFESEDYELILSIIKLAEANLRLSDIDKKIEIRKIIENKNKAGAEVTTQQQPASNLMSK